MNTRKIVPMPSKRKSDVLLKKYEKAAELFRIEPTHENASAVEAAYTALFQSLRGAAPDLSGLRRELSKAIARDITAGGTRRRGNGTSLANLRMECQVEHLHGLGARATFEAFCEVARSVGCWSEIERTLADFGRITPEMLAATGGDRFAPRPMFAVVGGRDQ